VLCYGWLGRLALPAPLRRNQRHGGLQEPGWDGGDHELGGAAVAADCFRTRYIFVSIIQCTSIEDIDISALGFGAINNADSAWTATFTTSLPNNADCDVISGKSSGGACTGTG
jgi:hypothetical protein